MSTEKEENVLSVVKEITKEKGKEKGGGSLEKRKKKRNHPGNSGNPKIGFLGIFSRRKSNYL